MPLRVTSHFGPRAHPITGAHSMHEGVDLAAAMGTPVMSVLGGRVDVVSLPDPGPTRGGYTVIIDHGAGWSSRYLHLSGVAVQVGQLVARGQVIGASGTAGTGPHLHLEIHSPRGPIDPMSVLPGA